MGLKKSLTSKKERDNVTLLSDGNAILEVASKMYGDYSKNTK